MKNILVVGGAGYIGSHMIDLLNQHADFHSIVLDDLSTGYQEALLGAEWIEGSIANRALLDEIFQTRNIHAVMHFASFIQVGESVEKPAKYYDNNLVNTLTLLDSMIAHDVKQFIFSSTAAIFGNPIYTPIDTAHPKNPINPYGKSKWMVEQILQDYDHAYGLKSICLRYFNAAGADPKGQLGERHDPETHLIPLILQAASGKREAITVFGRDYKTPDKTCVRDYIHICDLCEAHLLAINHLEKHKESKQYNLGNGEGFSVQQVIDTAKCVTQKEIKVLEGSRRAGDADILVADASLAKKELGWQPKYPNLKTIVEHAWQWEQKMNRDKDR